MFTPDSIPLAGSDIITSRNEEFLLPGDVRLGNELNIVPDLTIGNDVQLVRSSDQQQSSTTVKKPIQTITIPGTTYTFETDYVGTVVPETMTMSRISTNDGGVVLESDNIKDMVQPIVVQTSANMTDPNVVRLNNGIELYQPRSKRDRVLDLRTGSPGVCDWQKRFSFYDRTKNCQIPTPEQVWNRTGSVSYYEIARMYLTRQFLLHGGSRDPARQRIMFNGRPEHMNALLYMWNHDLDEGIWPYDAESNDALVTPQDMYTVYSVHCFAQEQNSGRDDSHLQFPRVSEFLNNGRHVVQTYLKIQADIMDGNGDVEIIAPRCDMPVDLRASVAKCQLLLEWLHTLAEMRSPDHWKPYYSHAPKTNVIFTDYLESLWKQRAWNIFGGQCGGPPVPAPSAPEPSAPEPEPVDDLFSGGTLISILPPTFSRYSTGSGPFQMGRDQTIQTTFGLEIVGNPILTGMAAIMGPIFGPGPDRSSFQPPTEKEIMNEYQKIYDILDSGNVTADNVDEAAGRTVALYRVGEEFLSGSERDDFLERIPDLFRIVEEEREKLP